jgi:hypothetical protein
MQIANARETNPHGHGSVERIERKNFEEAAYMERH